MYIFLKLCHYAMLLKTAIVIHFLFRLLFSLWKAYSVMEQCNKNMIV